MYSKERVRRKPKRIWKGSGPAKVIQFPKDRVVFGTKLKEHMLRTSVSKTQLVNTVFNENRQRMNDAYNNKLLISQLTVDELTWLCFTLGIEKEDLYPDSSKGDGNKRIQNK